MNFNTGSSTKVILTITMSLSSLSLLLGATFAASGGRMGGDSFSFSDQSSSSSSDYQDPHHYHYHDHHGSRGYSSSSSSEDDGIFAWTPVIIFFGILGVFFWLRLFGAKRKYESSVIMIQVGLTGQASSLQKELNEIAKTTDTSSSEGWKLILNETASALLRHQHYFISGYSRVNKHGDAESLEKNFRQLSMEEREKIDVESLVNVNSIRRQRAVIPKASKLGRNFLVVTVLIAGKGSYKIPVIRSIDDLEEVLRSLSFASEKLMAVEVLWTPQDETDTLSEEELLEDYPLLRPI
ncbi:uncharacterized protein LOC8280927 [Ricinus communis]|uniref:uncharacterized protein LOC8280927 n=1 Tax=Ricinus communis TaxID=3988 RepID=UPI000772902D|nr:uncharacterized protein LOC8280927 [Ricinus communis]|eukprot:XP_015573457.1 uncharacterized protein LOC8280927 [Ricinus communis]